MCARAVSSAAFVCSKFRMAVYGVLRHVRYQVFMYFVVLFDVLR
jgi:hypothetical protein